MQTQAALPSHSSHLQGCSLIPGMKDTEGNLSMGLHAPEPAMPSYVNGLTGRIQALWPANP